MTLNDVLPLAKSEIEKREFRPRTGPSNVEEKIADIRNGYLFVGVQFRKGSREAAKLTEARTIGFAVMPHELDRNDAHQLLQDKFDVLNGDIARLRHDAAHRD